MFYLWLIIVIFLAVIEAMTTSLTTIWFVISGIVAILVSFITDNFMIQFSIFCILGVVLLATTRSFLLKFVKTKDVKTNVDRIIGTRGIVTEDITNTSLGEVKVDGKRWSAFADTELKVNTPVRIILIDGVKVKVEKWED